MAGTVIVRSLKIGEGLPKICAPITGVTDEEIRKEASLVKESGADMAEWRMDWYADGDLTEKAGHILGCLRKILSDMPILATFRTKKEGGEREISTEEYISLNRAVIAGGADLIDAELSAGEKAVREIVEAAHRNGVKVVVSSHDFDGTPSKEEIIGRLCKMQELGADLPKIAVMPKTRNDVLTLLCATAEMAERHADRPIITMSMSGIGVISRLCGEFAGSAVTFGSAGKASAPGQMKVERLREGLEILHEGQGSKNL